MSIRIENLKSEIRNPKSARGFSLMEVLMAVGTLAVGMLFIAGVFPVSIHFTTVASERTIAATAADEAFAKMMLYVRDPCCPLVAADFQNLVSPPPFSSSFLYAANSQRGIYTPSVHLISYSEFYYPSTAADLSQKQYCWSALCRMIDPYSVQVTVFISRKVGANTQYYMRLPPPSSFLIHAALPTPPTPVFVFVSVTSSNRADELTINDTPAFSNFINAGSTIIEDTTGQIYRVLERYRSPDDAVIKLDKAWQGGSGTVWVIPPPVGGGGYPCIGVYQKVMRF